MGNKRLLSVVVAGAVIVGGGALSLQVGGSPWPGYGAGVLLLLSLWIGRQWFGIRRAMQTGLAMGERYGEYDYFAVDVAGDVEGLPPGPRALILVGDELLLLDEFRPDGTELLSVRAGQVLDLAVDRATLTVTVQFSGRAGERLQVRFRSEDARSMPNLLEPAIRAWARRGVRGEGEGEGV